MGVIGNGEARRKKAVTMDEFPTRLRKLRERQRRKQYVVSELCGLNRSSIRRYERGERAPGLKELISIADYFEVSIDYLVGLTDNPKRNT